MRLDAEVRRCVVFLGHATPEDEDSFVAVGTGFFVEFDGIRYLVTAQHVAAQFGDAPFCIRINRTAGGSDNVFCDPLDDPEVRWLSDPRNPDVDLAVLPFPFSEEASGLDMLAINEALLANDDDISALGVGVGDLCYAVGLFRLLQGAKRNMPVVHTGNIALMPSDEPIPVRDWLGPVNTLKRRYVRGYLVEMQNLKGLSGAPVIVRPSLEGIVTQFERAPGGKATVKGAVHAGAYNADVYLLGIWAASWDAPPDEVLSLNQGSEARVPVGLGTVVPTSALLQLLKAPHVEKHRRQIVDRMARERAAVAL